MSSLINIVKSHPCHFTPYNVPVIHGRHAPPIYGYDNPVKVHVTGVFKPGEAVRLYVNGQLMAEDTTNAPDAIGQTGLFKIGARSDNATQGFWDGQIGDLRITGRACHFTPYNVPVIYGKDVPLVYGNNVPPIYGNHVPLGDLFSFPLSFRQSNQHCREILCLEIG